ncbi:Cytochrome P450 family protein [Quillaja saponaria]|uniref:Cytochrome P450 family protein n=1 Tax=Quillaja saponaria TaxID=32244 RepID=A0AAD7Q816_QUISA|nr:Cytochrome P450 family protein [Quillaja saponaria]
MGFSILTQKHGKANRRMIHSLFTNSKFLLLMERTIQKKVESCLIPVLDYISQEANGFDLQDVFQRFTFDNICSLVFGFDPECLSIQFPEVEYEKAFNEMEEILFIRHIVPRSFWKLKKGLQIGQEKKLTESLQIVEQFIYERIASKRKEVNSRSCSATSEIDLLTAYIEEEEKGQKGDKYLRDSTVNLLVAGRDTLSAGLTWFFWLVATHPSVEARILEDIKDNIFATKETKFSVPGRNELGKLVYLHAAICESLRLFPPVPYLHVCATNSDILPSGHHIKPNTKIYYSLYTMGRMEETWGEDCLEFKPERWITYTEGGEGRIKNIPSYKFIAFSSGPRSCLGKDMSIIEMKMVATAILWNYHIKVVEAHHVSPSVSIVIHMERGLKVKLTKRISI